MTPRDHGGGLDTALTHYGGSRADWLDLSTGINPLSYPVQDLPADAWTALPDAAAFAALEQAARAFWNIPETAAILSAPGASALIARIPLLRSPQQVEIQTPTYNEHAAAFNGAGWSVTGTKGTVRVAVHPNNPTGRLWSPLELAKGAPELTIIDESFCDICPTHSHIERVQDGKTIVLKSFGKFWGLAGMRLGFAVGAPELIAPLRDAIGPWQVSGPALSVGAQALSDTDWAQETRERLKKDCARMDTTMRQAGAKVLGGTTLFRLYDVADATALQDQLAKHHIWSRIFPYSKSWVRLGLPQPDQFTRLEAAL
ncbi:MAG: threonine-phosphate decarboxylase CobD [Pseudoruegeria sp.]